MKKVVKIIITIPLFVLLAAQPLSAQTVVENIEGFPLMEGFVEDADMAVFFDKPEGRVLESTISGVATLGEVMSFYSESMGQIGWNIMASSDGNIMEFKKEDELLQLEFITISSSIQIKISLLPIEK